MQDKLVPYLDSIHDYHNLMEIVDRMGQKDTQIKELSTQVRGLEQQILDTQQL